MKYSRKIIFTDHPRLPFEEWADEEPKAAAPRRPHDDGPIRHELELSEEEKRSIADDDRLHYISLASGSSGNSCYLGTRAGGIIVDAGIRADEIEEKLNAAGIPMRHVKALLLTHDHSDHVRYSYNLLRTFRHLTLYCTPRVINGLLRKHSISKRIKDYQTPIFKEIPFKVADFEITAFEVPHDGSDNMGFSIDFRGRRFVIATDLGSVTERARFYMSQANYLVIEANYDETMLRNGAYPEHLKARIRAANGHLDNMATAAFLSEIINPELKYIFLCHLSKDNNTPALALKAVAEALQAKGISVGRAEESLSDRRADVQLMTLPRYEATRKFTFR